MVILIIIINTIALLGITIFSISQWNLATHYLKAKKIPSKIITSSNTPRITVQLPVFNEKYVIERLLEAIAKLDYPLDKLEVQVLNDSTDETSGIIDEKCLEYRKSGLDITHIQRENRIGYKAGALQYGMGLAKGDYLAIFDADFIPEPDFLKQAIACFTSEEIGMVQVRWGHLNENYNLATRMQAFGLNGHFTVEQSGRQAGDNLINFNGTAGIWKKKCIQESGGWQFDTLTEDLDLSYRAQLNGWKFKYVENIEAPAELPVYLPAIKSQQYRWNKGGAETARKLLGKIFRSNLSGSQKVTAAFHLLNGSVFLLLLVAAILSVPILYIKNLSPEFNIFINLGAVFMIGLIAIGIFYWAMTKSMKPNRPLKYFAINFPLFISFSMGMSLHNSIAILEGYLGIKTPFIRTPKFNVITQLDNWSKNNYLDVRLSPLTFLEGILALYFVFGIISGFRFGDYGLLIFHLMLVIGFGYIFLNSVIQMYHVKT